MKWIECKSCLAQTPVSDTDDPAEWAEPCEVCGNYGWREWKPKSVLKMTQEEIDRELEKIYEPIRKENI